MGDRPFNEAAMIKSDEDFVAHMAAGSATLLSALWSNHSSIMRALRAQRPSNDNNAAKSSVVQPLVWAVKAQRPEPVFETSCTPWPRWYVPPLLERKTGTELMREIATEFTTTVSVMKGGQRNHDIIHARAVFVMVMRSRGMSYPQIGRLLGGRDHSTVINTVAKWETYLARDHRVRKAYERLRQREASL